LVVHGHRRTNDLVDLFCQDKLGHENFEFLFVLFRVFSWISPLSRKRDPRNHTKLHQGFD
jgi:hypothetical protein